MNLTFLIILIFFTLLFVVDIRHRYFTIIVIVTVFLLNELYNIKFKENYKENDDSLNTDSLNNDRSIQNKEDKNFELNDESYKKYENDTDISKLLKFQERLDSVKNKCIKFKFP
jgi:hypothetical protein